MSESLSSTTSVTFDAADLILPPLSSVEITKVFLPLTLSELIRREGLTRTQASRVREGLRWAQRFGLIKHAPWEHYQFNVGDMRMALVLSIIVETARKAK